MKSIKSTLEYIWKFKPLAFTLHIAGWLTEENAIKTGKGYWKVINFRWWPKIVKVMGRRIRKVRRKRF